LNVSSTSRTGSAVWTLVRLLNGRDAIDIASSTVVTDGQQPLHCS